MGERRQYCGARPAASSRDSTPFEGEIMKSGLITRTAVCSAAAAALLMSGCSNMSEREKGTAAGAGIGAGVGAVLSSATGGKAGTGAVVGGALGAVAGNIWSKRQEDRRIAMEQAT